MTETELQELGLGCLQEWTPHDSNHYVGSFFLRELRGKPRLSQAWGRLELSEGEGGCYTSTFLVGTGHPSSVWLPVSNRTGLDRTISLVLLPFLAGILRNCSSGPDIQNGPDELLNCYKHTCPMGLPRTGAPQLGDQCIPSSNLTSGLQVPLTLFCTFLPAHPCPARCSQGAHSMYSESTCGPLVCGPGESQRPCPDASHRQHMPSHLKDWGSTNRWTSDERTLNHTAAPPPGPLPSLGAVPALLPRAPGLRRRGSSPCPQPLPALCPHLMPVLTRWLILAPHQTVIMGE